MLVMAIPVIVTVGHHRGCGDNALERRVISIPLLPKIKPEFKPKPTWNISGIPKSLLARYRVGPAVGPRSKKLNKKILPVNVFAMASPCASPCASPHACVVFAVINGFAGGTGTPSKMADSTRAWRRKPRKSWWKIQMGRNGNQSMPCIKPHWPP